MNDIRIPERVIVNEAEEEFEFFEAKNYKVILWNDNYTLFTVVTCILTEVFELEKEKAVEKAIEAHTKGKSLIKGYESLGVCNQKIEEANQLTEMIGVRPLRLSIEE